MNPCFTWLVIHGNSLVGATFTVTKSGDRGMKAFTIILAICIIYGITDETHQLFVPGRAFQLSDLVMDAIGSMIGIAAVLFVYNRVRRKG